MEAQRMHPDLALLMQPERRDIVCLALEGARDAQIAALCALEPFHVYRQGVFCALLFDGAEDRLPRIRQALGAQGLCAGLSGPFALAASAHGCMTKAQLALATGRLAAPGETLYPMDDYGEAALLRAAAAALPEFTCGDFGDAALAQMARVDAQEGTQYAPSLRAYLSCGLNLRQAAQALGVHRNTLDYRMQRVQERFHLNLADMNACFELLFAFWLRDHLPAGEEREAAAPFDAQAAQAALWRHVERVEDAEEAGEPFALALVCVGVRRLADEQRDRLTLAVCAQRPGTACAFDEDALLFALPPEEAQAFAEGAQALCAPLRRPVVVTQPFLSARIGQKLRLCRYALRAAASPLTRLEDVGSTLFFMALERRVPLAPYLCEDVIRVMDDDAMKGASLSKSLYAYLLNFRDMKKAAQQLGMHRNTMEYQLRKIVALIGEMPGEKKRFLMMCTYKMLALPDTGACYL